jgi:hypothetical protein
MEVPIKIIFPLIIGTILALIYHVFTKVRDHKNNFLRISDELRKPFIEAKSVFDIAVRGIDDRCLVGDVFIKLYSDQKRSIQLIIPHIPIRQRSRLQKAWEEYEEKINNDNPSSWFSCDNIYKKEDDIIEKRKNLINQLDNILFFFDYHNMFSVFNMLK